MSTPDDVDFSYRALSDADESSRAHRASAHAPAETASSFMGVTTTESTRDTERQVDDVHVQLDSTSPGAAPSATHLHALSLDDWTAEEQGRQEVRSHEFSNLDGMRRASTRSAVLASIAASHLRIDVDLHDAVLPSSKAAAAALTTQSSVNLHGKDFRQFVAIGSISRRSNSVDWSDTMANATDEPDHLSLMDPYYDLTRTKLTKLFSLFQPDGACVNKTLSRNHVS